MRLLPATVAVLLIGLTLAPVLVGAAPAEVTWADLLPKEEPGFHDPFAELSEKQLLDLALIARIRLLLERETADPAGAMAREEKGLVAKLAADGIDVDWILSQRERVKRERQKAAAQVDRSVDGREVRIPGYMLPLEYEGSRVSRFLLVPWVGACIHTPPPPPNQMFHVTVPGGVEDRGRFAALWVEGVLRPEPANYDLFLVDGTRSVGVAYVMSTDRISGYSDRESNILAQVEVPEFGAAHGWWGNLQAKVALMFTKTMSVIRNRESPGPLWAGLLIAFAYGLVHTLGPGHGKAVVISYFVGEGGGLLRGVSMGARIAVFHVLSALVVVWLTDFAVRQATGHAPSDYRIVRLISYAAIAGIGGWMLWRALKAARHSHSGKGPHHGCRACAAAANREDRPGGWLALAVGSVPCTGALLVLLFGMANDLLGPAVLMVAAISAGMAVAMSGIGLLAILGRRLLERKAAGREDRLRNATQSLRIAGASAIVLIGLGLLLFTWTGRSAKSPPLDADFGSARFTTRAAE